MASKIETICYEKIVPLINDLGYEVIEIDYSRKIDGMNLTFTIFKPEGIVLNDCETVHRLVDKQLEELNPTDDTPYILNVESEGLDRPIKSHADFLRHKGEEYEVKLYVPIDGKKSYKGSLIEYDEEKVTLEINGKAKSLPKEKVAHIVPVLSF